MSLQKQKEIIMNKKTICLGLVSMIAGCSSVLSANAGTVGFWRFEDGASGSAIVTAVSEVNSPAMNGSQWNANATPVLYSSDRASLSVYDPVSGLYLANTGAMHAPAGANTDNSQIVVHDMSALDGSFTLEMFVKVLSNGSKADLPPSSYNRLFNLDGSTACNGTVGATGSGTTLLKFKLGSEGVDYSSNFEDESWHHLAYVVKYDVGSNTTSVQLFRDSKNVISSTYAGKFSTTSYGGLRFGVSASNLSNFDWFLDDVRLSDTALTPAQFLQRSDHAPSPVQTPAASVNDATVGFWRFEGGASGSAIVTATSEVNSPAMDGAQWNANATAVLYSGDKAGAYVIDPVTSESLANTGCMRAPAGANTDNNQIVVHDMSALDGSWTLEMFVKVLNNGGKADLPPGAYNRLFNLDGSLSCNAVVGATGSGTTLLKFKVGTESKDYSSNFEDESWHHLAYVVSYDAASNTTTFKLYRDSKSVISSTTAGKFAGSTTGGLRFGVSSANVSNFDWLLDDVRLSNKALTPDQFLKLSAQATP
jgi:hypothetical protein